MQHAALTPPTWSSRKFEDLKSMMVSCAMLLALMERLLLLLLLLLPPPPPPNNRNAPPSPSEFPLILM